MKQSCVSILDKGAAIACGLRLDWLHLGRSEIYNLLDTLH